MNKLKAVLEDIRFNFDTGMLSFIMHRITGIALVTFLGLHVWTLSAVFWGPEAFNAAVSKFDNPLGHALEYTLLLAVTFHFLNGLRVTAMDLFGLTRLHNKLLALSCGLLLLVAVLSFRVFFY